MQNIGILMFILKCVTIEADVLLWSTKNFEISPLLPFGDDSFNNLIHDLGDLKVFFFKLTLKKPGNLPTNLEELIDGRFAAYNANGQLVNENAIEIEPPTEKCNRVNLQIVKHLINMVGNSTDYLAAIDITYDNNISRVKRRALLSASEESTASMEVLSENKTRNTAYKSGTSVVYKGKGRNGLFAILYSSRDLDLTYNDTTLKLGDPSVVTVDTRMNVVIPVERSKIILRFVFTWLHGYWYLPLVKLEYLDDKSFYNLTTDEDVMAPAHFSYHCSGQTTFSDPTNLVALVIYDLQVQPDSRNEKFGDANDCVPFTTAPIWSGLFVTTILGIGLIVALTAIMDIKTMDKFDNHKTKNIAITISE